MQNKGHRTMYIYEVNLYVILIHYPKYHIHPRYKTKLLTHEIKVTDPHIFYEANLCVTLIHYPKYNILLSSSVQDIMRY